MILDFRDSLPMVLNRTLDAIMPAYRELFARFDITEQQWRILRVLWEHEKITTNALADLTLLPAPSLVGIIDRMEKKKLVSRIRSTKDRRVIYILLTTKGRKIEKEVMPFVKAIHQNLKSVVNENEWLAMQETLEKISTQTRKHSSKNQSANTRT